MMEHPRNGVKAASGRNRFRRLTPVDLMFLRLESPDWPCHFGGLAVLDGHPRPDASGGLQLSELRERLDRRVSRVPQLRRRVYSPGPLRGGPLWVDDERFSIEHHVRRLAVEPPGDDDRLLETAARLCGELLDRSRPLWELWFLTGLSDGRVAVLLKVHHAVADGEAAVAIMASLFDLESDGAEPLSESAAAEAIPGSWELFVENVSRKVRVLGRAVTSLAHPARVMNEIRALARMTRRYFTRTAAPSTSLNRPVRAGRRVLFLRLELGTMKEVAHGHQGKVNDVVLALWSGGLRSLLAARGEPVAGLDLITSVAVSLRSANDPTIGNQVGTMVLALPVSADDVRRRLDQIVRRTGEAKAAQRPIAIMGYMAGLAASPIGRYFTTHQRANNVITTNVMGPPEPVFMFGARVLSILPIISLVGNIGLTLCAFSYAGDVFLVVTADATAFSDIDVLMEGMEADWRALTGTTTRPDGGSGWCRISQT